MVPAHRARHAGGDGNNHHGVIRALEASHHNRNQDAERAPAGTGGKRQPHRNQENNRRQIVHKARRRAGHDRSHELGRP